MGGGQAAGDPIAWLRSPRDSANARSAACATPIWIKEPGQTSNAAAKARPSRTASLRPGRTAKPIAAKSTSEPISDTATW